jgi:hypothetical protein
MDIAFMPNYFFVRDGVSVDSESLLVTDFVNLKIKPTQSFEGAHRGRVCMHVFIGVSARTYMSICILHLYCVSQKKIDDVDAQIGNRWQLLDR